MNRKPTLAEFKVWARSHHSIALTVCQAQAFAEAERERVNAYILPLFALYGFKDEKGKAISSPDDLYRCADEPALSAYYEACDLEHRNHGLTGPHGYCPALMAETLLIDAQNALLDCIKLLFGIGAQDVYLDDRRKMLDLLLGACLKKSERRAA